MRNYAIVGLIYSQACPLSCNFCCHTKEVVGHGKFSPDLVTPFLLDFSKRPEVIRIAFSGGDPFLFLPDILEIMSRLRSEGVTQPFHMVTSGYWATDLKACEKVLSELSALGMDALDVSYDTEHARFVPRDRIDNISTACHALGIKLEIFGNFWNSAERVEDLLPNLKKFDKMYSNLVMPIGAARVHFKGPRYQIPEEKKYACGKPGVYDVAIYPDGTVYPCCSGGFNKEAKLECGNVFSDSAEDILRAVFTNFHARIAKEIGFDKLYKYAELVNPELFSRLPKFSDVDSVCEICRDINSNPALRTSLDEIYNELELDYVMKSIGSLEKLGVFEQTTDLEQVREPFKAAL